MILMKKFEFDAAHRLVRYHGKCERLHGHTYGMVVKLEGTPDHEGMIFDFVELKKLVNTHLLCDLDHRYLNDILPDPSAENIVVYAWNVLEPLVRRSNYHLFEIEIWETKDSGVAYRGEGA